MSEEDTSKNTSSPSSDDDTIDPEGVADATGAQKPAPDDANPPSNATEGVEQAIDELDALLADASFEDPVSPELAKAKAAAKADLDGVDLPQFDKVLQEAQVSGIDLLRDVNLDVKIELGRSRMLVEDVLKLVEGSVVELDKLAGDPVDVYVNERLVARGEVLVLNDNFCIRVNEIVQRSKEEDL